ncbi:benzoate 4-monooxygenase cytochrome p450 [Colletotrichum sojae]|uniref:Benzoate 4-monooxygenase cytochrome p450 n=1 Tax=Colletotrichum sojae TaxID=2175907 RepID=A0A8H6MNK6_9PEZI|nr:benzoate 4-monooxygenase cytochrome p450 [Colletotrichum sojae]
MHTAVGGVHVFSQQPQSQTIGVVTQHQQSYIDQQVLDSLFNLASGQPHGANSFVAGSHTPWSAPDPGAGAGTSYPALDAETTGQMWEQTTASSGPMNSEMPAAWLGNDTYADSARALSDLQWPLPGTVSRPADGIDWSSEAIRQQQYHEQQPGAQRGLPRRRSRYRFIRSEQRSAPIPIPLFPSSSSSQEPGVGPLQRWKDSPPQDEPAAITAIYDALKTNQLPSNALNLPAGSDRAGSRATSGTSADSGGSSSSMQSASSAWSTASKQSRGRRRADGGGIRGRVGKKRAGVAAAKDSRPYKCTFCCDSFKTKYDWARHEKSRHLNLESWVCAPRGPSVPCTTTGIKQCVYCGEEDPSDHHLEGHNHTACHERPAEARSFGRKDHLVQHLRVMHKLEALPPRVDEWRARPAEEVASRCGFCGAALATWGRRTEHLAAHFRKGATMAEWTGEHGFAPDVAERVAHALPPYLIGSESMSVVPFSATKQGTRDHFAQISSRTRTKSAQTGEAAGASPPATPVQSPSILSSRAATSKAFTDILERHLKHFADEHGARGVRPTDDMLRRESRRVIYDSDDEWNQTVADNSEWLSQFRKRYGLYEGGDGEEGGTQTD